MMMVLACWLVGGGRTRVVKQEPPCLACPVHSSMKTMQCVCDIRVKHCVVVMVVPCAAFFRRPPRPRPSFRSKHGPCTKNQKLTKAHPRPHLEREYTHELFILLVVPIVFVSRGV